MRLNSRMSRFFPEKYQEKNKFLLEINHVILIMSKQQKNY